MLICLKKDRWYMCRGRGVEVEIDKRVFVRIYVKVIRVFIFGGCFMVFFFEVIWIFWFFFNENKLRNFLNVKKKINYLLD